MPPIQRGPVLSPPRFFMVVTAWRVNLLGEIIKNHTLMLNISKLLHFSFCLNSVFTNDGYFGSSTILFPFTVENCPKLRKKTSEKQKTSKHVSVLFLVFLLLTLVGYIFTGKGCFNLANNFIEIFCANVKHLFDIFKWPLTTVFTGEQVLVVGRETVLLARCKARKKHTRKTCSTFHCLHCLCCAKENLWFYWIYHRAPILLGILSKCTHII